MAIAIGTPAPPVEGLELERPRILVFYKTTCSVTVMAAGALARFGEAFPGRVAGIGQDPAADLDAFAAAHGWGFPQLADLAPYHASNAYGIASAPTVVVVGDDGTVIDVVESWDREGENRAAAAFAALLGAEPVTISAPSDGLPDFKPG